MGKRALFDVSNEDFAYFINEIGKNFDKEKIPYIFVGGTAVQLHIAKRLTSSLNLNISQIANSERLQDYLRATDDVDIVLSEDIYNQKNDLEYAKVINRVLDSLQQEVISPSKEHIFEYKLSRRGVKRPVFERTIDGEESDQISLNLSRKPSDLRNLESSLYQTFVSEAERITVPYNGDFSVDVKVIPAIYLLATKISHFRAKDTMDIHSLMDLIRENNEPLDLDKLKALLGAQNTRNYERFLSLAKIDDTK